MIHVKVGFVKHEMKGLSGLGKPSTALKISGSGTTVALNDRAGTARINTDRYTGFRATEHRRCDATIYVTGGATLKTRRSRV